MCVCVWINPATGYVATLVGKFETDIQHSIEFAHLVGKFDTVSINGLEFAHQVGKFDTVLNIGLEFAHLLKIVSRFSWDCFTVGKFDTEFEDGV